MFEEYNHLILNQVDANLIVNKKKELNDSILSNIDLLIIPSPIDRDRKTSKNNLTQVEKQSIIDFINRGGKLIIFMDEDERVDREAFGETMTGLFMGGVRMKLKDGSYIVWKGKDDKIFMQKLIEWLLKQ